MRGNKILLVDDEEIILKSCRKELQSEGYHVTTASSGQEAIEKIQAHHFDMVVTDLCLPGVDGIAVLVEARQHNPDIAAIVLTGGGDTALAIEALRRGADDYVLKPCDSDELLLRIARCLKNREAYQKVAFYEDILPVCISCKSIRVDKGSAPDEENWMRMEEYFHQKKGTDVSHTFCPQCKDRAVKDILDD